MADTTEMIRLMRHSAGLLKSSSPTFDYTLLLNKVSGDGVRTQVMERFAGITAAMTFAEVLLLTVAAAMEDEPTADAAPASQPGQDRKDGTE